MSEQELRQQLSNALLESKFYPTNHKKISRLMQVTQRYSLEQQIHLLEELFAVPFDAPPPHYFSKGVLKTQQLRQQLEELKS